MNPLDLSDVRMVITPHDLERVGRFRYSVYVEEQGKHAAYADHEAKMLIEPEDRDWNTRTYWVERDGEILGTVRAQRGPFPPSLAKQMQLDRLPFGGQQNLVLYSRLMIAQKARHSDVIGKIFVVGFAITPGHGLVAGVLTCTPVLTRVFEMLGCAAYAEPFMHDEAGLQQPMAVLGEVEYLRQRGSHLANWLATFKRESPTTNEFLSLVHEHRERAGLAVPRSASRLSA